MSHVDEQFARIARRAVEDASKIKCSMQEHVDGLERIIGDLEIARDAGLEDIENADRADVEGAEVDEEE